MRHFLIGIACSAAFLTNACGGPTEKQPSPGENAGSEQATAGAEDYYTVRAGPVANNKISALAGTFQMLKVSAANGIPSAGGGGACLAFPAAELGFTEMAKKVCHDNGDCSVAPPDGTPPGQDLGSYVPDPANPAHRENRYGYCDMQSNKCWSRPFGRDVDAALCNKPITMTVAALNPVPKTLGKASQVGIKAGMKVRVIACLNKGAPPYPPPAPPCGQIESNDRIEVMGPEAMVKP